MATFRKYGSRWRAEVRVMGSYKSSIHDTKAEAKAWANATEQAMGKHGGIVLGRTFGDAVTRFTKEISSVRKGARWEMIRGEALLRDDLSAHQLSDITGDILQGWVEKRLKVVKPSSVNRELNFIASILTTARRNWRWMANDPMKDIRRPKNPPHRDRRLSDDEIKRVLMALGYDGQVVTVRHHIAVAFLLALETAMRQGEIYGLKKEQLHLKQGFLVLPDTKNGSKREVPLSSEAIRLLGLLGDDLFQVCTKQVLEVTFRRAVKLAGLQDLHFHDSRHEAITRLARKLDILDLARMVGHRDIRSLSIYYNPTASEIAKRLG